MPRHSAVQYLTPSAPPPPSTKCPFMTRNHWQGVPNQVRGWGSMSPPAEKFEHYMMPYVRFPLASPVVAMKMLSFRLKGGGRSSGSSSKHGGGDRSGTLHQFCAVRTMVVEQRYMNDPHSRCERFNTHEVSFRVKYAAPNRRSQHLTVVHWSRGRSKRR